MEMTIGGRLVLAAASALSACAHHAYDYTFHLVDPGARATMGAGGPETEEDADLRCAILVDARDDAVLVDVANKTDMVLQIEWAKITIARPDGGITPLRPDVDVGWIAPGAHVAARLFPVPLARSDEGAAATDGRAFRLDVPAIVRREPRVYHYTLVARVHKR